METGISPDDLQRCVDEQIFSLPGTKNAREEFSVLLTGSRATGTATSQSDVDLEVICPREVYDAVQRACLAEGRIKSATASLYMLRDGQWREYFGEDVARSHFSLRPADEVARHFETYDDVFLWIWTNAVILHDPGARFANLLKRFQGYPKDVLVRKIKYRWMLSAYWMIETYPHHHSRDEDLLPAGLSILNAVNELYRFFFIVEGKPFPYTEKLPRFVSSTALGKQFLPFVNQVVDLALGRLWQDRSEWDRLDQASRRLCHSDESDDCRRLEDASAQAMLAAGVEEDWVRADFDNINELLQGKLGPMP